jgi:hypothetical protein
MMRVCKLISSGIFTSMTLVALIFLLHSGRDTLCLATCSSFLYSDRFDLLYFFVLPKEHWDSPMVLHHLLVLGVLVLPWVRV